MNDRANLGGYTRDHGFPPPIPPQATKRRSTAWRWLALALAVVAGIVLVLSVVGSLTSSSPLEVVRNDWLVIDDGKRLRIVNVGSKPIKIVKVTVNERDDCRVWRFHDADYVPVDLKVGDRLNLFSGCRVIRALIHTDQGAQAYSF